MMMMMNLFSIKLLKQAKLCSELQADFPKDFRDAAHLKHTYL